jgi:hypothetical protein
MYLKETGVRGLGIDSLGSGQGQVAGCCANGSEFLGFIKCEGFLD